MSAPILLISLLALGVAVALRPWRALDPGGPPWPWLAWWVVIPLMWGADRYVNIPLVQPLSGACLLLMLVGWPMTVIALVPAAAATAVMAGLTPDEAVQRYLWLGLAPATAALALGAAVRRWLPRHLMVYILGRGFFVTALATTGAGVLAVWSQGAPAGLAPSDVMLGRWLAAWGDAWLTGMVVAIFVAFRPQWLATYADRLYLPDDRPRSGPGG